MDLSEHTRFVLPTLRNHIAQGLNTFGVPENQTLAEWAEEHFYLSAESSYVEQKWVPWSFQRAIMACISNDDIREINLRKSARVGYTKIILAAIGYFAHHKRRNQCMWQPTDDDRDEFVKTELDPMLRDVAAMQDVFPAYLARHKDNTLQAKKFLGSICHLKGGKAAKNYRRISIDTAYLDEYDAFDANVEKEGDPATLAAKRIEGATFPKLVIGSTPKLKGFSNIEKRERVADISLKRHIPCPECGEFHPIEWGGKDEPTGFKWTDNNPATVRHLCPHCGALIDQAQFLAVEARGIWMAEDGTSCDDHSIFRNAAGEIIAAPAHIAFFIWSAYSPNVDWIDVVREFIAAYTEAGEGKKEKLQAFWNTTLGEYWAEEFEKTDENELRARAEPFPLERIPMNCLYLLAGVDTQPNRLECNVWGYGRGCETWTIADRVFFGNPDEDEVWADLEEFIFETEFPHAAGTTLKISGTAIDTRGHNTHAVYNFCAKHAKRKVFAVAGRSGKEKHIRDGASKVDIDWRGRLRKNGLVLWWVGTNHAKDLIHGRLQITRPGPGYIHFSNELSDEWFRQFTGEARITKQTPRGEASTWTATRKRVEKLDCAVYATWLETYFELSKKPAKFWDELEEKIQPATLDLFTSAPAPKKEPTGKAPVATKARGAPHAPADRNTGFGSAEWSL